MPTPSPLRSTLFVAAAVLTGVGAGHAFDSGSTMLSYGPLDGADAAPVAVADLSAASRWRQARRHAMGAGTAGDHWLAFQAYARIAGARFASDPSRQDAPYVGAAMREMGRYYLVGIDGSPVVADPRTAESYLYRAASLFGDADAQFELGRFYLDARWGRPRRRHAARWFALAARKGHHRAQSELGVLLCEGQGVARDTSRGILLMASALRNAPTPQRNLLRARLSEIFSSISSAERTKAEDALRRANLPPITDVAVADGS